MKYITDKAEITEAFKTLPIIKIDMQMHIEGYDTIYEGEKVKVAVQTKNHGTLHVTEKIHYSEESKKFYVPNYGSMLTNSFGYSDVMELYEKNHAPTVAEGTVVGILEVYPISEQCRIRLMKATRCNLMYTEACVFEDVE